MMTQAAYYFATRMESVCVLARNGAPDLALRHLGAVWGDGFHSPRELTDEELVRGLVLAAAVEEAVKQAASRPSEPPKRGKWVTVRADAPAEWLPALAGSDPQERSAEVVSWLRETAGDRPCEVLAYSDPFLFTFRGEWRKLRVYTMVAWNAG